MSKNTIYDVLIIGSGPAGYSAAIYATRANCRTALVSGNEVGGQLSATTDVENYPGFADTIQGPWLMEQMLLQTQKLGTEIINSHIAELIYDKESNLFQAITNKKIVYQAHTVIIATGAQAKWLGLENEKKFLGFGVSGCATCDGFFYGNQIVMVVGGGNTAIEEALYLTNHASKVILIHRRDSFRAEKMLQDRVFKNNKIEVIWNHVLEDIIGTEEPKSVTHARIKNTIDNKIQDIELSGIFIAIGHKPNTQIFANILELDPEGYITTQADSTKTEHPGLFAAGDVQDKTYKQAITAAGTGCMAALDAIAYLEDKNS